MHRRAKIASAAILAASLCHAGESGTTREEAQHAMLNAETVGSVALALGVRRCSALWLTADATVRERMSACESWPSAIEHEKNFVAFLTEHGLSIEAPAHRARAQAAKAAIKAVNAAMDAAKAAKEAEEAVPDAQSLGIMMHASRARRCAALLLTDGAPMRKWETACAGTAEAAAYEMQYMEQFKDGRAVASAGHLVFTEAALTAAKAVRAAVDPGNPPSKPKRPSPHPGHAPCAETSPTADPPRSIRRGYGANPPLNPNTLPLKRRRKTVF